MKASHAHLFADIAWSTDSVAETTRLRCAQLGLDVVELPAWYDVDDQDALRRLVTAEAREERGLTPYYAPFTMRALQRMEGQYRSLGQAAE